MIAEDFKRHSNNYLARAYQNYALMNDPQNAGHGTTMLLQMFSDIPPMGEFSRQMMEVESNGYTRAQNAFLKSGESREVARFILDMLYSDFERHIVPGADSAADIHSLRSSPQSVL